MVIMATAIQYIIFMAGIDNLAVRGGTKLGSYRGWFGLHKQYLLLANT